MSPPAATNNTAAPAIVAYSTDSAGMHPILHTLPIKIHAIARAGFTHIELSFSDLEGFAEKLYEDDGYMKLGPSGEGDLVKLCGAAKRVRELCGEAGLKVLALHPFARFEGHLDPIRRRSSFQRAAAWFKVLQALGCDLLQVGSSNDPTSSSTFTSIAHDLRTLADMAAKERPMIRIAYEPWAWGCNVNTWSHAWEICKRVDRPNFGLCLDTFQICAREYVSSTNPPVPLPGAQSDLAASLRRLSETIKPEKIFYLQISDGSRKIGNQQLQLDAQEQGEDAPGILIDPLYTWSNGWRPLPFMDDIVKDLDCLKNGIISKDDVGTKLVNAAKGAADVLVEPSTPNSSYGGFLPVMDVIKAVLKTGWNGPWSYEVFFLSEMALPDPTIPTRWAQAGMESHRRIQRNFLGHSPSIMRTSEP